MKAIYYVLSIFSLLLIISLYFLHPMTIEERESGTKVSAYEEGEKGLSNFRKDIENYYNSTNPGYFRTNSIVTNPSLLSSYAEPERTLLVVIGLEREYSAVAMASIVAIGRPAVPRLGSYLNDSRRRRKVRYCLREITGRWFARPDEVAAWWSPHERRKAAK